MRMQHHSFVRLFLLLVIVWCLGFTVGPVVENLVAGTQNTSVIYQGICHQDAARSFSWFGSQWSVCHRCSAIYLAFAIVALAVVFRGRSSLETLPRPWVIGALLLPIVLDGTADFIGIRSADLASRLVTGGLAGAVLAVVIIPILDDALHKLSAVNVSPSPGGHDA